MLWGVMWSPTLLWLVCSSPEGKGDTEQAQLLKTLSAAAGEAKEQNSHPHPKSRQHPRETQQASRRHSTECTAATRSSHKVLMTIPAFAKAETCGHDYRFLANSGRFRLLL